MAALLTAAASAALAQSVSNQAWIGQTGDTNTITVIQTGIGNAAGANAAALEINQGDSGTSSAHYNTLVINQFGWNNKAGAIELSDPDAPRGINQLGDRNTAKVFQKNGSDDDANSVGAIYQWSHTGLAAIANSLDIKQSVLDNDRSASHAIGYVSQANNSVDLGANIVDLLQSGGLAGIGNAIERVIQLGYGNFAQVVQNLQQNTVGSARQIGNRNELVALQGEGETNTVVDVAQIGDLNHARISQSGDRNYVASAYQNNEGIAISGNTLAVTLAGNNNGGDETGGLGGFKTDEANAVSVYQGTFSQIGDDNDIRFTVNGGDENLFGVFQTGDGNGAIIAIGRSTGQAATYASKNETAVVQTGDDNAMSATIIGNKNAVGTTFDGDRNALSLEQTGDGNKVSVSIFGNDNNNSNSPSVGGFAGNLRLLAVSLGLTPGQGLQSGTSNRAVANVFNGDGNLFAFKQHGDGNAANFDLSGTSNQSLVSQAGDANHAQIKQSGTSNSMAISQF